MSKQLSDFKVLTFDCYGTLIDWESGIWDALQPLIAASGRDDITREVGLAAFAETLETVVVDTIQSGSMTKDLALLVGDEQAWLSTTGFLDKVAENLEAAMRARAAA